MLSLRGGWICICSKFCAESSSERILKIDQYFVKLSKQVGCLVFWLTLYMWRVSSKCHVKLTDGLAGIEHTASARYCWRSITKYSCQQKWRKQPFINLLSAVISERVQCESRDLENPSTIHVTVGTGQVTVWLEHRLVQVNHSLYIAFLLVTSRYTGKSIKLRAPEPI